MTRSNNPKKLSELSDQEFDQFLRDIDDLYGEAPELAVPPNFIPRIVELAMAEQVSVAKKDRPNWSIRGWFFDFSYAARVALASALLLAGFGGFRAGQVLTGLIARQNNQQHIESVDPLGLAVPEQAIVQLVRYDGLNADNQPNKTSGGSR
ncbi:MAG: hypothetical protein ACKVZH_16955 [Blastocatellia bacterium]